MFGMYIPRYCATKAFLSTLSISIFDQLKMAGVDCLVTQPGMTSMLYSQRAASTNTSIARNMLTRTFLPLPSFPLIAASRQDLDRYRATGGRF